MDSAAKVRWVSDRNPIHRINPEVRDLLIRAQSNLIDDEFQSAGQLYERVLDDVKIAVRVPPECYEQRTEGVADLKWAELYDWFLQLFRRNRIDEPSAHLHAVNAAQRFQLLRAFEDPDAVLGKVVNHVTKVAETFPRDASHIERGSNPGDVIDPYILAASQILLCNGDYTRTISTAVAHKALMKIEGMLGHLHENVIGYMRGNIRAPEPRGFNQEILDPFTNPFPGADVVQPPATPHGPIRFHQVKSKTGSAKGGDGRRLGEQLQRLTQYYGGEAYYDALIGNTLRGHRSMGGVLSAAPNVVVLVGDAAFLELTHSDIGPELLLRLYQTAFGQVARENGYSLDEVSTMIAETFFGRAKQTGTGTLETMLRDVVSGPASEQDSRHFGRQRAPDGL